MGYKIETVRPNTFNTKVVRETKYVDTEKKGKKNKSLYKKFVGKKKLVKKPSIHPIEKRDILKQIKQSRGYEGVKQVEEKPIEQGRSLYFNSEYNKEKTNAHKWLK